MQVAGNHHNGVALAQIEQVAAFADAHFGNHIATGYAPIGQINVVAAQPFAEQLLEEEHVLIADAIAADASNGRFNLL